MNILITRHKVFLAIQSVSSAYQPMASFPSEHGRVYRGTVGWCVSAIWVWFIFFGLVSAAVQALSFDSSWALLIEHLCRAKNYPKLTGSQLWNPRCVGYEESHQWAASVPQIKCVKGRCWKTLEVIFYGQRNTVGNFSCDFQSVKIQMISFSGFLFQDLSVKVGNNFELSHIRWSASQPSFYALSIYMYLFI